MIRSALLSLGLVWAGAFSAACSSSSPASSTSPATFTQIYAALFPLGTTAQCNYCHARPANDISDGMLPMGDTPAVAYAALVGPTSASSKCGGGRRLVVPGDPDSSLFYQKLTGSPPCGAQMPQGATPLSSAQLEMVRSWIVDGAKNN